MDTSGVFVDYEKARNDLRRKQAHFIPNTDYQLTFHSFIPFAFIEERNGIREATVTKNSDTMGLEWIVNCKKKQLIWKQTWPKAVVSEVQQPKRGTQGYVVMVNICSLPTQPALTELGRGVKWK
jgi:hypothetical protein